MSDFEAALITAIVEQKNIRDVLRHKINSEFFSGTQTRAAFTFLERWYQNPAYADTPSWESFQHDFQEFVPVQMEESIIALCDKVRERKLFSDLSAVVMKVGELAGGNPQAAFDLMKEQTVRLVSMHNVDDTIDMTSRLDDLRREYFDMKSGATGLKGKPYPWPALNEATLGLQDQHLVFLYGRPKSCKCIPLDEPVLSWDGTFTTIEKLRYSVTVDPRTLCWTKGNVVQHTKPQLMECYEVVTETGYRARLGTTHPLLRPNLEYTPTGQMQVGDYIGVAGELPEFPKAKDAYSPETGELLGMLIGDGNYTRAEVQFTTKDEQVLDRLHELVRPFNCSVKQATRSIEYRIVHKDGRTAQNNELLDFLRTEGLHGKKGREKEVPQRLYRSGTQTVLAFLGGLLVTDGHVSKNSVEWATSSVKLARQIKHLLLRVGVVGSLRTKQTYSGPAYVVAVSAQEQFGKLLPMLPYVCLGYKAEGIIQLVSKDVRRKRHNDGIPWSIELEQAIHTARPKASNGNPNGAWPEMWEGFSSDKLFRRTGVISRHLLRQLAKALKAPHLLRWADSPVRWERIVEIRPLGKLPTADAGVAKHHNFLVGDLVTHNTWLALEMIKSFHKAGARPLIFSQELSDIEVCRRFVALSTGVNYSAFLRGALPPQEEADFLDNLEAFAENPPVHVSTITQTGPKCLTEITSAIQEYQATVVLIDGVYFLGSDWKEIAEITRGLKRITKQLRVPIIGTTQANRSRGKKGDAADGADDFAYGDAFYQDCDLALRVTRDIEDLQLHQTKIFTAAIREGQSTGFTIHTRIAGDFTQKAVHKMADEGTDMDGNLDQDKMDAESDVRQ